MRRTFNSIQEHRNTAHHQSRGAHKSPSPSVVEASADPFVQRSAGVEIRRGSTPLTQKTLMMTNKRAGAHQQPSSFLH